MRYKWDYIYNWKPKIFGFNKVLKSIHIPLTRDNLETSLEDTSLKVKVWK